MICIACQNEMHEQCAAIVWGEICNCELCHIDCPIIVEVPKGAYEKLDAMITNAKMSDILIDTFPIIDMRAYMLPRVTVERYLEKLKEMNAREK